MIKVRAKSFLGFTLKENPLLHKNIAFDRLKMEQSSHCTILFRFADASSQLGSEGAGGAAAAAGGSTSKPASKDIHNDTTVSDISADITMDSVKDHTM